MCAGVILGATEGDTTDVFGQMRTSSHPSISYRPRTDGDELQTRVSSGKRGGLPRTSCCFLKHLKKAADPSLRIIIIRNRHKIIRPKLPTSTIFGKVFEIKISVKLTDT